MKHAYQVKMYGTDVTLDLILIMCKLVKFRTTIHTSLIDPPLCICLMYSVALFRMWARDTCDDIIPNHVISHDLSRNLWHDTLSPPKHIASNTNIETRAVLNSTMWCHTILPGSCDLMWESCDLPSLLGAKGCSLWDRGRSPLCDLFSSSQEDCDGLSCQCGTVHIRERKTNSLYRGFNLVSLFKRGNSLFPGITQCTSKLKMREMPVYMHIM